MKIQPTNMLGMNYQLVALLWPRILKDREYVRFDVFLVCDGVWGGGDGAIYRCWNQGSESSDEFIQSTMSLQRWFQLKRVFKLNNKNTAKPIKRSEYNPCINYDTSFYVIINNTIALTNYANLDWTGDETIWPHKIFGKKGAKKLYRVVEKPGILKGGQIAIFSATNRICQYWYQHRHKFIPRYAPDFNAEVTAEVRTLIGTLEKNIEDRDGDKKKTFQYPFHQTWDNYF